MRATWKACPLLNLTVSNAEAESAIVSVTEHLPFIDLKVSIQFAFSPAE